MSDTVQKLVILFPILLISMSIHEMMHAYAADSLGDDTARSMGRLSLNPLRHVDPIFTVAVPLLLILSGSPILFGAAKPVQVNFHRLKYGEFGGAIVGAIGPLTNLFIAAVVGLIFGHIQITSDFIYNVFKITIALNVGLFLFNSIPWPPLDGSRVLYAFAPRALQEFMESMESTGMLGLVILILILSQTSFLTDIFIKLIHLLAPGLIV